MVREDLLPLHAECAMLFQMNPSLIESVEGLSVRIGRQIEELCPVLDLLVKQGILQLIGSESSPLYRYNEPVVITEINKLNETGSA